MSYLCQIIFCLVVLWMYRLDLYFWLIHLLYDVRYGQFVNEKKWSVVAFWESKGSMHLEKYQKCKMALSPHDKQSMHNWKVVFVENKWASLERIPPPKISISRKEVSPENKYLRKYVHPIFLVLAYFIISLLKAIPLQQKLDHITSHIFMLNKMNVSEVKSVGSVWRSPKYTSLLYSATI